MRIEKIPFYQGRSVKGHLDFFLLSSALQKSIRRWMLDDALYYAREFLEAGQSNYLLKRLFIILVEDIWVVNIYLCKYLLEKVKEFESKKNWDEIDENIIYEIVTEFCLSPKNREDDYFIVSYYNGLKYDAYIESVLIRAMYFIIQTPFRDSKKNEMIKEIIDYLKSGKILYEDKRILKNSVDFINEMYEKKENKKVKVYLENILINDFFNLIDDEIFNSYFEAFFKVRDLNWKDWLMLFFTFFELYRRFEIKYDKSKEIPLNKNSNLKFVIDETIKPKDFMYDKHTLKGKALWRWLEHFVREGGLLNNEVVLNNNKYTKLFYDAIANGVIKD